MSPDLIAGRYRVTRAVGRGGMGTVWLCHDEVLGREVAVKQVGNLPGESATDTARALREARSSAALNHKNVVSVFDVVDTEDGNAWLVMEYVPSRTLSQILREDGPVDPRRAARVGAQVADGLAAAHARGTIHRDVKPGNILVSDDDVAKISDFGIARMAGDDQLTRTGLVTGTPSYFSPELARGNDPGPESDVYALGASLYAAVEGAPPYPEQRNAIAMLQQIATQPPPDPARAGPLAGAIGRMMDRDPGSRWSMADAAHALRRLAEEDSASETAFLGSPAAVAAAPLAANVVDDTPTSPSPAARRRYDEEEEERSRRGALPWLVAASLVLLLALGAGYLLLDEDDPADRPQAGDTPSASPSPGEDETEAADEQAEPEPEPEPEESASDEPVSAGDGAAQEQFVEDYFAVLPADTDAGWAQLAPSMQEQGRDDYDAWWESVEQVTLQETTSVDGRPAVDVVLTYQFTDGSASEERQRLTLERSGDRYLIADDEVLSSRTVS